MATKKTFNYQMPDWVRESISEFLGTFLQLYLVLVSLMLRFTVPNMAQRLYTDPEYCFMSENGRQCLNETLIPEGKAEGDVLYNIQLDSIYVLVIAVNWASGLLLGLMLTVPLSGGYLNPATSLTLATMKRLQWKKLLHYIPSQYLGSFFAAICFDILYSKHMVPEIGENWPTKRRDIILYVLTSAPHKAINMWTAIIDSFFASAIFSLFLFAIIDERKDSVPKWAQPLFIVLTVVGIVIGFFADSKVQLSPARDLGTRLYAGLAIGFEDAFSTFSYFYWFLPKQICLYAGAVAGGWLYVSLFGGDINENISENKNQNNASIAPKSKTNDMEEKNVKINEKSDQNLKTLQKTNL